jgi:hypothetical protein
MTWRVNNQRSLADPRDQDVLDEVQLEVLKMKMWKLKATLKMQQQQQQQQQQQLDNYVTADSDSTLQLRELAMQLLQFPVPRGCFAPCLNMIDMCVMVVVVVVAVVMVVMVVVFVVLVCANEISTKLTAVTRQVRAHAVHTPCAARDSAPVRHNSITRLAAPH